MKLVITVGMLFVLILLSSGCVTEFEDEKENEFVDVDITYPVREVYRGYEGGNNIIIVDYYVGDDIRTVDNQQKFGGRVNLINIRRSASNDSYLYWYVTNSEKTFAYAGAYPRYPRNKYVLYLADDLKCEGIETHISYSDQPDYDSFIERQG